MFCPSKVHAICVHSSIQATGMAAEAAIFKNGRPFTNSQKLDSLTQPRGSNMMPIQYASRSLVWMLSIPLGLWVFSYLGDPQRA
jgi:hypothetical protein